MNKIALSLLVLAALSTASMAAGNRSWDLQDSEYYNTQGTSGTGAVIVTNSDSAALAVPSAPGLTAFERAVLRGEQNDQSNRH